MRIALAVIGAIFWAFAALTITFSVGMEVSIPGDDYAVANLSLMHFQALAMQAGIGAMIVGTLMICTAALMGSAGR